MKQSIPKPPEGKAFALYLHEEGNPNSSSGYYHLRAKMAVIHLRSSKDCADGCELGGVRYGDFMGEFGLRAMDECLSHLVINSQGGCESRDRSLYAWEVGLRDMYLMELCHCRAGVVLLETIERKMEKEKERFGPAQTFGQYVCAVGRALNCQYVLFPPPKTNGCGQWGRMWANGYHYHVKTVGEAVARIDQLVWEFVHAVDDLTVA